MFPLAPPPPDVRASGPLPDVVSAVVAAIEAERRESYEAATTSLRLTETGGLGAGAFPARPLEENGARTLLVYYNAVFPRFTPTFLRMPADLASACFHTLLEAGLRADREGEIPRKVRVRERKAPGSLVTRVFAVTTPTYADGYDVDALARDVEAVFGTGARDVHAEGVYSAGLATLELRLRFPAGFGVLVTASDAGGDEGSVRIRGLDAAGRDVGEPCPHLKRRKRAGRVETDAEGMAAYLAAKIAGVPELIR